VLTTCYIGGLNIPIIFVSSEELDGPAVNVLRSANAEVKDRWLVIGYGWPEINYLELLRALEDTLLIPAAFAVVSTHQPALGLRGGLWPVSLCVIHKKGLFPSNGDINRLMMMMMMICILV
jgi:hypothetical protein